MKLSEKIWWTRVARIETERRLLANLFHAELILVWYALFSVGISIYSLNEQNNVPQTYWVIFSVLTLACSLYINTQSYKERAMKMKTCYEKLGLLSDCVKTLEEQANVPTFRIEQLQKKYVRILDICENHLSKDYHQAIMNRWLNNKAENSPSRITWYICTANMLARFIVFLLLYSVPIIILIMNYLQNVSVC